MAIQSIGWEVTCEGPDDHTECPDSAAYHLLCTTYRETTAAARIAACADGWNRRYRGRSVIDMCPRCAAPTTDTP